MGVHNGQGIDCGSGAGMRQGRAMGKSWDNYNWTTIIFLNGKKSTYSIFKALR